jgi:exonuclease III
LLGALAPDIALLQECRPTDLRDHAPDWMTQAYRCIGQLQPGWILCTSMLVREPLHVEPLDPGALGVDERRWLGHLSGCVAAATVNIDGDGEFAVAGVHALAERVDVGTAVTPADHERIRRTGVDRATYNDVLAAALEPWVTGRRFLVGGDWNDSPMFDTNYPNGVDEVAGSSTEFFERRKQAGWWDAMRKFHDGDVRTFLDPRSRPYELDRVFTDAETCRQLIGCHALDHVVFSGLSDHAPLVVEFAT